MARASSRWGSGAENGVQTQIHPSDLLWSPLFCPFKRVFLRKAHKGRHLARQMWITEAWPLPAMSPLGPGWGPESRPVSFGVFSPVKSTVLPQRGGVREANATDAGSRPATALMPQTPWSRVTKGCLHASSNSNSPAAFPDGNSPSFTQFTGCKLDIFFYVIFMGLKAEQNKIQFSSKDDSLARSQAIHNLGTEAVTSPHPRG